MERDRRPVADDTLGAHRPAVRLDEMSNDRQAEAGAAFVARAAGVDAIEALEDAADVLDGNASPGVAHAHRHPADPGRPDRPREP